MDPLEIQAFKDHLVQEADLEAQDQEVILVHLESKGPLVMREILDTSQVHMVHLGRKVFLDDLASKGNQHLVK